MATVAEADLCAIGEPDATAEASAAPPEGASAGDPRRSCVDVSPELLAASLGVPAAAPSDDASGVVGAAAGATGSAGVVVVVASGVPESCAAEMAGAAQIAARTSIPLARALAPFIDLILGSVTSLVRTDLPLGRI
jgi:hypothetical protein